jgi:hypothetical protein
MACCKNPKLPVAREEVEGRGGLEMSGGEGIVGRGRK